LLPRVNYVKLSVPPAINRVIAFAKSITDPKHRLGAFITKMRADNLGLLAGFLSWSILTSIIPIVVGIVAITSFFLHSPTTHHDVEVYLSKALVGVLSPSDIKNLVATATKHSGLLAVIGFLGILWGSSNVGGAISTCCQAIFEVRGRPFLREKLIDFLMLFILIATVLVVLAGSMATAFLNSLMGGHSLSGVAQFVIGTVISLTAGFLLFSSVYLVFPNIEFKFKRRFAWLGAVPAAAMFQIVSYVWPIYVQISHFSKYSAFLFSVLVLTAWIYLFCMILMIGAEVVAVFAIRAAQAAGESVGPRPQ
jgi:YihY family inner membrane protein